MWVHELKGSGDLDPLERVSHRFVSGVDDEAVGYAAGSLRQLRAKIMRRTERLKVLDRAVCPDKRTTRQIAAKRSLKLCGAGGFPAAAASAAAMLGSSCSGRVGRSSRALLICASAEARSFDAASCIALRATVRLLV